MNYNGKFKKIKIRFRKIRKKVNKLNHIANYYNLSKRKLKKDQLIDSIVQFENNPENSVIVYNRKKLWHYLTELKNDSYFGKFVIFN